MSILTVRVQPGFLEETLAALSPVPFASWWMTEVRVLDQCKARWVLLHSAIIEVTEAFELQLEIVLEAQFLLETLSILTSLSGVHEMYVIEAGIARQPLPGGMAEEIAAIKICSPIPVGTAYE